MVTPGTKIEAVGGDVGCDLGLEEVLWREILDSLFSGPVVRSGQHALEVGGKHFIETEDFGVHVQTLSLSCLRNWEDSKGTLSSLREESWVF